MWAGLMGRLEKAQSQFTTEEDPLMELMREVLPRDGVLSPRPVRKLYADLKDEAENARVPSFNQKLSGRSQRGDSA